MSKGEVTRSVTGGGFVFRQYFDKEESKIGSKSKLALLDWSSVLITDKELDQYLDKEKVIITDDLSAESIVAAAVYVWKPSILTEGAFSVFDGFRSRLAVLTEGAFTPFIDYGEVVSVAIVTDKPYTDKLDISYRDKSDKPAYGDKLNKGFIIITDKERGDISD